MSTEPKPTRRPLTRFTKVLLAMAVAGTVFISATAIYAKRWSAENDAAARAARVEAGLRANETMHGTGKDCPWNGEKR